VVCAILRAEVLSPPPPGLTGRMLVARMGQQARAAR